MTKDRRLGRGLAALLGTPLDEMGTTLDASAAPKPPANSESEGIPKTPPGSASNAAQQEASRSEMIRALNGEAHQSASKDRSSINDSKQPSRAIVELPVSEIDNNPFQPRRQFNEEEIASLAASLKEHEQLQPVLVRKVGNRYQLISGERRLRASIYAGMTRIRAEIREADDRLVAELAIVENLQRKDLNPVEKALSFKRYLSQHKCTQEDLAKRLKIDRSTIANLMRLLELPERILDAIQKDELSAGHARALLPLGEESQQLKFAKLIVQETWSVRETERQVAASLASEDAADDGLEGPATLRMAKRTKSDQIVSLEKELKLALGTKVEIKQSSKGRGKIVISFGTEPEFERIRDALCATSGTQSLRVVG